jgi:hypothetical protein
LPDIFSPKDRSGPLGVCPYGLLPVEKHDPSHGALILLAGARVGKPPTRHGPVTNTQSVLRLLSIRQPRLRRADSRALFSELPGRLVGNVVSRLDGRIHRRCPAHKYPFVAPY